MTILDSVRRRIAESASVPIDSIDVSDHIRDDLGIPSVEMIRLIGVLEEEHNISVTDEEFHSAATVGELIQLVFSKVNR